MSLRLRKDKEGDVESGPGGGQFLDSPDGNLLFKINQLQQRNRELEIIVASAPNKNLPKYQKDDVKAEDNTEKNDIIDRGRWLVGLLVLQSCSSFILANYEKLLAEHQALIYFLTMLVGAGGNAGNQACVKMVRELAIGIYIHCGCVTLTLFMS